MTRAASFPWPRKSNGMSSSTSGCARPSPGFNPFRRHRPEVPMHGDFKTPGGKLVRVDFDLDGGRVRNVVVSGDFFLYHEEVIDDIRGAREGASADLTETDIAIMVASAMPVGAEWL